MCKKDECKRPRSTHGGRPDVTTRTYRYLIVGGGMTAAAACRGIRAHSADGTIGLPSLIDTAANRESMSAELMTHSVAPDDIAAVAAFLCSDAAIAITGAAIPVYGWA
jgi:NAD(P)-dependent dehydrogenase (short-subunit alcohol dehydrogenase family)